MKAWQAQLDEELRQAQEKADWEEKECAEVAHQEWEQLAKEAAGRKKAAEAKAAQERCEQEAVKAWVAKCEACAKMLIPAGEPIMAVGESVIFWLKTATAADQKAWGHAIDFVFLF